MKPVFYGALLLCYGLLQTACLFGDFSSVDDYEVDFPQTKLVVNGDISPQLGVRLHLSRSADEKGVLVIEAINVENAAVALWENGLLVRNIPPTGKGNYFLSPDSFEVRAENTYRITAFADGLPEVQSAEITIPIAGKVAMQRRPWLVDNSITGYNQHPVIRFDLEIADPRPQSRDFYNYNVRAGDAAQTEQFLTLVDYYQQELACDIQVNSDLVFPDDCATGTTFLLRSEVERTAKVKTGDSLYIHLRTIDSLFFEYVKSLDQPTDIWDFLLIAPHPEISNIQGGYGIVTGLQERRIPFAVP